MPDAWRLVVDLAGPSGFRDRIVITSADRSELEPKTMVDGGQSFERYGDDDDYVEVRPELIVLRSLNPVELPREQEQLEIDREAMSRPLEPPAQPKAEER